jgi:hypothetical protein
MARLPRSKSEEAAHIGVAVMKKGRASIKQASKLLHSDIGTIEHRILQGQIEAFKVGKFWKIPVYALIKAGAILPHPSLVPDAKGLEPLDSNESPADIENYYD